MSAKAAAIEWDNLQQLIHESDAVNESRVQFEITEASDSEVSALLTMLSVVARRWVV